MISLGKFKFGVPKQSQSKELGIREERKQLLNKSGNFFVREAYKALRTNVTFSLTGEEKSKVIVVTSGLQGEGKSITAVNLAISYAQAAQQVLLIDCDLRRPKLSRLFELKSPVGLSNLLLNPELEAEAILNTDVSGLDVILAGDIPPNPSELLGSQRMEKLLNRLKERYDYIILDTPPVNVVTDAVVLAPRSDGFLFVVRTMHSERNTVRDALEQLEYAQAKILGFVVNGIDLEKTTYGYNRYRKRRRYGYRRGYYGKGYGYGGYGYGGYGYGGYSRGYGYGYYGGDGYGYGYGSPPKPREAPKPEPKNEGDTHG